MQLPGFFFVFCCLWSLAQPRPQYDEANTALESQSDNCWASLDQTSWPQVISFDGTTSTIRIHLQQTKTVPPSAPNRVTECLKGRCTLEFLWTDELCMRKKAAAFFIFLRLHFSYSLLMYFRTSCGNAMVLQVHLDSVVWQRDHGIDHATTHCSRITQ